MRPASHGTGLALDRQAATFEPGHASAPDAARVPKRRRSGTTQSWRRAEPVAPLEDRAAAAIPADEPPLYDEPAAEPDGRGSAAELIETKPVTLQPMISKLRRARPPSRLMEATRRRRRPRRARPSRKPNVPQPESAERATASEAQPAPADRRAEIYVLRHAGAGRDVQDRSDPPRRARRAADARAAAGLACRRRGAQPERA